MTTLNEMQAVIEAEFRHAGIKVRRPSQGYFGHLYGDGFTLAVRNSPKGLYRSDDTARIVSVAPSSGGVSRWGGAPTRTYRLRKDGTFNIEGIVEAAKKAVAVSAERAELAEQGVKVRKANLERVQVAKAQLAEAFGLEVLPYRFCPQEGVEVSVDSYGSVKIELANRSIADALELLEKLK